MRGLETDQKAVDNHLATLTAKLQGYEAVLAKQKYIGGDVRIIL